MKTIALTAVLLLYLPAAAQQPYTPHTPQFHAPQPNIVPAPAPFRALQPAPSFRSQVILNNDGSVWVLERRVIRRGIFGRVRLSQPYWQLYR